MFSKFSSSARTFSGFFVLLAIGALAHDILIWQRSNDYPFAFADLGWMTKTYLPEQHAYMVSLLGVETFNIFLAPVLRLSAVIVALGLMGFTLLIDGLRIALKKEKMPPRYKQRR